MDFFVERSERAFIVALAFGLCFLAAALSRASQRGRWLCPQRRGWSTARGNSISAARDTTFGWTCCSSILSWAPSPSLGSCFIRCSTSERESKRQKPIRRPHDQTSGAVEQGAEADGTLLSSSMVREPRSLAPVLSGHQGSRDENDARLRGRR